MDQHCEFRKEDFDKFDDAAKVEAISLLHSIFNNKIKCAYENPDKYGVDLIVIWDNGSKSYFEVEFKTYSNISELSKNGIHIAARKQKYYSEKNTHHITFLGNYQKSVIIKNTLLQNARLISKDCIRGKSTYNQQFLEIDLKSCLLFEKIDQMWKKVKRFE